MALPLAGVIAAGVAAVLGSALARLMVGAGIAFVTYNVIDGFFQGFLDSWASNISGLPTDMLAVITILGVVEAVEIIGSAIMTVVALKLVGRIMGIKLGGSE